MAAWLWLLGCNARLPGRCCSITIMREPHLHILAHLTGATLVHLRRDTAYKGGGIEGSVDRVLSRRACERFESACQPILAGGRKIRAADVDDRTNRSIRIWQLEKADLRGQGRVVQRD